MTGERVWEEPWPEADPALLASDEIQLVVQLNGKLVDRMAAPAEASQRAARGDRARSAKLERAAERQGDRQGDRGARQAGELRGPMNAEAHPTRIPIGPLVAAIGAVLLIVSLFLDWYEDRTGFTVFEVLDLVLVACALAMIAQLAGGMGLVNRRLSRRAAGRGDHRARDRRLSR